MHTAGTYTATAQSGAYAPCYGDAHRRVTGPLWLKIGKLAASKLCEYFVFNAFTRELSATPFHIPILSPAHFSGEALQSFSAANFLNWINWIKEWEKMYNICAELIKITITGTFISSSQLSRGIINVRSIDMEILSLARNLPCFQFPSCFLSLAFIPKFLSLVLQLVKYYSLSIRLIYALSTLKDLLTC